MGCAPAMLSGSGSVVFGVFQEEEHGIRFGPDDQNVVRGLVTSTAERVEPVLPVD